MLIFLGIAPLPTHLQAVVLFGVRGLNDNLDFIT